MPTADDATVPDAGAMAADGPQASRSANDRYASDRYGSDRYGDDRYGASPSSPPGFQTQSPATANGTESVAAGAPTPVQEARPTPANEPAANHRLLPPATDASAVNRQMQIQPGPDETHSADAEPTPGLSSGRSMELRSQEPTRAAERFPATSGAASSAIDARWPERGSASAVSRSAPPGGAAATDNRFGQPAASNGNIRMSEPATLAPGPANPLRGSGEPPRSMAMPLGTDRGVSVPRGEEGNGRPGHEQLEGLQSPSLTIEKFAPAEIQIGKSATFEILVRNTGKVRAQNVTIHDEIPKKTQLVGTTPPAGRSPQGDLVWNLGAMEPGAEQTVQVEVMPIDEGEIGSVATVQFTAHSSVKTTATRPELQLEVAAPKEAMIGGDVALVIKISNPGTGPASGVVLKEFVPDNFSHPGGTELEYEVGDLKPKETRELELVIKAAKAGVATNLLTARGDGSLQARSQTELEVIAPALAIGMEGPKKRYLEREATYTVSISNPGTAAAREVELVTYLPKGLEFIKADNYGEWDAQARAVRWSLEELPANETGSVTLTAMPVEAGEHKLLIEGTADQGLSARQEQSVLVEGVAAILFQVVDVEDPIEVNGETTYEIRVVNQGSKAATDVQLQAVLPPQMKVLSADGPTDPVIDRDSVLFGKLGRLAPKADTTYHIRVQGLAPGDLRMRVQVVTNEITTPVSKEESTRVYADE
jgi:uncharacterized repeat protein (TIGR01451 family)